MVTKIILVRHGQTNWNLQGKFQGWSQTELLKEGEEQAALFAKNYPLDELDVIYSSDLNRAYKTASFLAEKFKLPIKKDKRLREFHFGDWEGESFKDINSRYNNAMTKFFNNPLSVEIPNGENFLQVQKRAMEAIEDFIRENQGKTIAVFSHGGTNKAILSSILKMPTKISWHINQSNTAYNIFTYDDEYKYYYTYTINNTSHLLKDNQNA